MSQPSFAPLIPRLERLLDRLEHLLDRQWASHGQTEVFDSAIAFRWVRRDGQGRLEPIRHPDLFDLNDIIGFDHQIQLLIQNTHQFVRGLPANHVLLWGARGTGKSSAVKGCLTRFAAEGLRMIEVHKSDLIDLPLILDLVWDRPERFIIFCDDLSFDEGEGVYRELKAILEGGLTARPDNVLVYATSNRRHLMPERFQDNVPRIDGSGEIHPGEGVEEKISFSDRFGLSLSFYSIDQKTYLQIVDHWAARQGLHIDTDTLHRQALQWALRTSGRSGRVARQFVDDLAGRLALQAQDTGALSSSNRP
ncbi:MAG: ATP-binding protein [Nitrospinota bacterium]|nr:MAG: ATP-binding protein [Nitrospinota bacterium]